MATSAGALSGAFFGSDLQSVLLYESAALVSLVLIWAAARRVSGRDRAAWLWVAAGITLWVGADLVWDALFLNGEEVDASAADVVYLAGYIVLAVAILLFLRHRPVGRREALLDGTAFASAAGVVIWLTLARPESREAGWTAAQLVLAAYPMMDALLLAALLWLVLTPGGDGRAQRTLIAAVAATAALDFAYAAFSRAEMDGWVAVVNASYPSAYAIVALAVAQAATASDRDPALAIKPRPPHLHPARALLLGAALVLAPVAAAMSATAGGSVHRVALLVVTCAISVMVLARFVNEAHARERIHAEVLHLASHDPLTGLMNRRAFLEELERQLTLQPCSLLYVDLDGFKWVNDFSGHYAGDDALVNAARRLREAVREGDVVARLGGDEFAVCCPGLVDQSAAELLAERVRASLERIQPGMTASVGVASCPRPGVSTTTLLKQADAAMYRAKRAGGNKTWTEVVALGA